MIVKRIFAEKIEVLKKQKDTNTEPVKLSFIASTPNADRYGDIIEQSGWQLDSYKKNNIVLFNHNPQELPIAKGYVNIVDDALMIDIEFDMDDERAAKIARKAEKGFLNAVSVGFNPIISTPRAELPDGHYAKGVSGTFFEKAELLEVSIVTIPANSQAVAAKDYLKNIENVSAISLTEEQSKELYTYIDQLRGSVDAHARQASFIESLFNDTKNYYTDDDEDDKDKEKQKEEITNYPKKGENLEVDLNNSQYDMFPADYAARLKEDYPQIWNKGGNILGNQQYKLLTSIIKNEGRPTNKDQEEAIRLREGWAARHINDYRLPGVIAQIKWYVIGSKGLDHMQKIIKEEIDKSKKNFDLKSEKNVIRDIEALFAEIKDTFKE